MVKKSESNRNVAKEIRSYMKEHPHEGPKAVAEGLMKLGVATTAQYVSTIKNLNKKKATPGKSRRAGGSTDISYADLKEAKKLVDRMGGLERARRALDAYAELVD